MHDPPKSETSPDFLHQHQQHQQHQHQHQHRNRHQHHSHHSTHLLDIDEEQTDTHIDHTVLDNRSIAAITTGMASIYGQRPDTAFPDNHSFMSAAHSGWQEVPPNGDQMPFTSMHQQQPFDQYHHAEHPPSTWSHQPQPQAQAQSSLNSTPQSAVFGAYPADPSVKAEDSFNNHHHPELPQHALPASTAPEHNPYATSATSPQSENGWISTSSSDPADKQLKREQLSPLFIDNPPRLRPDGVRKKNARFEIPEERKVDTIDKIILQTDPSDEKLLKELKQQKRLLRNRQAASVTSQSLILYFSFTDHRPDSTRAVARRSTPKS